MDVRVARDGNEIGTYDASNIDALLSDGILREGDHIYSESEEKWVSINTYNALSANEGLRSGSNGNSRSASRTSYKQHRKTPKKSTNAFTALMRAAWHLTRAGFILFFNFIRLLISWITVPLVAVAHTLSRLAHSAERSASRIEEKLDKNVDALEREIERG